MSGYNFTDRVRKVLQMAREEAARLHHEYVGTEHILLGVIKEGEGVAVAVLTNLNVDLEELQQRIEGMVKRGIVTTSAGDLPYTSRAKKVLEFAMSEAREMDHTYVGSEHLLLGLLREEKGLAAQALMGAGVNLEQARDETLRLLGRRHPPKRESRSVAYELPSDIRGALEAAFGEARRLGSNQVDAVHIALAILRMKDSAAVRVLTALGANAGTLLGNLEAKLAGGSRGSTEIRDEPYSDQARNVLELAMVEGHDLGHRAVGLEHLLLAVMREGVFEVPNASLSQVRAKVAELRPKEAAEPRARRTSSRSAVRGPGVRVIGGTIFILSGAEALWYAPGLFGKAMGLLGALGGLSLLVPWPAHLRR